MDRRTFLRRTVAPVGLFAVAGCLESGVGGGLLGGDSNDDSSTLPDTPRVEDPPDVVYVPTHRESMRMLDPIDAGEYTLAPMLSYPHSFWTVDGRETNLVEPQNGRGVHMMFTRWDDETGTVLPVGSGATVEVTLDGDSVGSPTTLWPMISQEMGFHFGDNVPLEEDGTYTVSVELPPIDGRKTGGLEGRFTEFTTASFEFEYDEAFREAVVGGVEYLDEDVWGEAGALEGGHGNESEGEGGHGNESESGDENGHADDHDEDGEEAGHGGDDHDGGHQHVPSSRLPPADQYPGTLLGEPTSGDAVFVTVLFERGSRFVEDLGEGDDRYLLVAPRTPYNDVPLADMVVTASVDRDGETVVDSDLVQTLDGEYGLHYGLALSAVEPGDVVTIAVEGPPQVARHQGYETAFLEMEPMELEVPDFALDAERVRNR